jgi:hypothetical protein
MATFTNKKLIKPLLLTTVAGSLIYTVPASVSTILTVITVTNTTATTLHFDIHLCDQDDAASTSNAILNTSEIEAYTVANFNFGQILSAGDKVRASADATGLALHMSGIEISL